jgi:hypothetical protein
LIDEASRARKPFASSKDLKAGKPFCSLALQLKIALPQAQDEVAWGSYRAMNENGSMINGPPCAAKNIFV